MMSETLFARAARHGPGPYYTRSVRTHLNLIHFTNHDKAQSSELRMAELPAAPHLIRFQPGGTFLFCLTPCTGGALCSFPVIGDIDLLAKHDERASSSALWL